MDENYCALAISIICVCSPEQAFEMLDCGKIKKHLMSKEDARAMVWYRSKGLTYRQIGELFYIDKDSMYKRIKRAKTRLQVS